MADRFNTYIEHIEPEFWRELCVNEGKQRRFERGEELVREGIVAQYRDISDTFRLGQPRLLHIPVMGQCKRSWIG